MANNQLYTIIAQQNVHFIEKYALFTVHIQKSSCIFASYLANMESLIKSFKNLLSLTPLAFKRYLYAEVLGVTECSGICSQSASQQESNLIQNETNT